MISAANLLAMTPSRFSTDVYAGDCVQPRRPRRMPALPAWSITPGYDLRYLVGSRAQTFERLTALVVPAAGEERSDREEARPTSWCRGWNWRR